MQKVLHYLSVCKNQACNKACHISCPVEFRVDLLPQSNGMICFKIAHYQDVRSLYYDVFRNGEVYTCLLLKHLIIDQVSSLYNIYVTGKIERNRVGRLTNMIPLGLDEFSEPKDGSPGTPTPPHYNIASKVTETKRT